MNDTTKEILTQKELDTLEYTRDLRQKMASSLTKNIESIDFETAEVANKVLDSMDKAVYTQSQLRLKHQENQNAEAMTANVVQLLKKVSEDREKHAKFGYQPELPQANIPVDFVPGENVIDDTPLNPEDFNSTVTVNGTYVDEDEEDDEEEE